MNRPLSALFAALDALIAIAIGVGIPLLVTTLLWAVQFGLAIDWTVFWRAAVDTWLLGNGVDLTVHLDAALAASLGLPGAGDPFSLTLALTSFAILTLLLGWRSGARLTSSTEVPLLGAVVGVVTVAVLSGLLAVSADVGGASPQLAQAVVLPALVYAGGLALGLLFPGRTASPFGAELARRIRPLLGKLPDRVLSAVFLGVRGGAVAAAGLIAASAASVVLALLVSFADVVSLYESAQAGILGGLTLTTLELALIPNFVAWAASWFVGPGFAIGAGTSVSPIGTHLALVPPLPAFGALPHGSGIGLVGILVPVAAAFLAGAVLRQRFRARGFTRVTDSLIAAAVGGAVGAVVIAVAAAWSAGSMGPGRLAEVGPNAWMVLLFAFVEFAVGIAAGLLAPLVTPRRPALLAREGRPAERALPHE